MIIDDNNVVGAGLVPAHDAVLSDDGSIVGASDHDVVPVNTRATTRVAPSAPGRVCGQRGESPLQAYALRPVTNCNCVAVRRGGKQQEVTDQSVGDKRDSAVSFGEPASDW